MCLFCENMLQIATTLARTDPDYLDMALKFVQHFLWIASSMANVGGGVGMWDEEDGFFYDVLRLPNGQAQRLKVRSMVGLLPLCAATTFDGVLLKQNPEIQERLKAFITARPEIIASIHPPGEQGVDGRHLISILNETMLRRVLAKMLDENEFLSPYGLRSLSRFHAEHPFVFPAGGQEYRVCVFAGRIRHRHVRRQLQLARAYLDAGQRPCCPGLAAILQLLWRRFQSGMPHRLRPPDDPVRGG